MKKPLKWIGIVLATLIVIGTIFPSCATDTDTPQSSSGLEKPSSSEPIADMVWIPKTGSKYHKKSSCSNMKNPSQVTKSQAVSRGYEPCKKCY